MSMTCPRLDDEATKDTRFRNRVVIVTGGGSGIGRSVVKRFVNDGAAHVAVFELNRETLPATQDLSSETSRVTFHEIDVSDNLKCLQEVRNVADENGGAIHHLVNNAAYCPGKGLDAKHADWQRTMDVNVEGYSNMVQACYPHMKNGDACTIVNVASLCAHRANLNRWTYSASKGAIVSMTRCMALDLAKYGIRVNAVSPGCVWTPSMIQDIPQSKWELRNKVYGQCHILGRVGYPEEIAAAITFLSSRDASFFTGADVPVDGGYGAMSRESLGFKAELEAVEADNT